MRYITRERIHVDRIATAWAIRRFIDPDATFEFVPRTRDIRAMDGIPFDCRGAELSHHDGHCTFEALLEKYELTDDGLQRMAKIIRSADLPQEEPSAPEAAGVPFLPGSATASRRTKSACSGDSSSAMPCTRTVNGRTTQAVLYERAVPLGGNSPTRP